MMVTSISVPLTLFATFTQVTGVDSAATADEILLLFLFSQLPPRASNPSEFTRLSSRNLYRIVSDLVTSLVTM